MKLMRWSLLSFMCLGLFSLASCSRPGTTSDLAFIPWSSSMVRNSTIGKALEPELHICLQGSMNPADLERVKTWARRATLTWLRALKMVDERVVGRVLFSCEKSHLRLNLRPGGGTSYASPSVSTIYLTRPYGTWTHELGHALAGLSDTYSGSSAGVCRSGQPESLMCWGAYGPRANPESWSTQWSDDIAGIRYNYAQIFGATHKAPDWVGSVNPEAPLDLEQPWPGYTGLRNDGDIISSQLEISENIEPSVIDYENRLGSIDL